ncbi:olfactory receptor 14C36 [Manis pentadactyla]|uniref:olfactory receptor 14C36 n=1 Tax=Manis pentadactyla TaxID=143292 RepID=UPI00255C7405|nr:olfactory receptor 14C36 [Manis pentadactyla]
MPNSTTMLEFLLMGFSDVWELRALHAISFSLMYLVTLMGNILIVTVTTLDRSLHTPMYFFLRNLSILDACYTSVTVPNSCINALLGSRTISKAGCVAQVFLVVFFVYVELLLLTIMARDRYVAICQPLLYPVIMSPRVCVQMTLASILSGLAYAGVHTGNTFRLSFCWSNMVHQFFCDIPSLLRLSCSDTSSNEMMVMASGLGIGGGCFIYIIKSYIHIFSTVLKFPNGADRTKAFSTCVPHILVVSVFLSSGFYVYLRPSTISATIQDMVFSVFYSIIPPLFNPIIYSLRTEQIKCAIKKIMKRMSYSGDI